MYVFLKPPHKTQGLTEGKSSMVILIDVCFHGIKCFQNQPQLVSVLQHGKNLACYSFLPKRETEMLAKALNILASTANRFHLFLAASKLTSDVGKRKALEERGTGVVVVVVPIFFHCDKQNMLIIM